MAAQLLLLLRRGFSGTLLATDPDYPPEMAAHMAAAIRRFVELETEKLSYLVELAVDLEDASQDLEKRNDPVSMYFSVSLLVDTWRYVETVMKNSSYSASVSVAKQLPQSGDTDEVLSALFRIQDTYALNVSDIVSGSVAALHQVGALTAYDCYDIGVKAFQRSDQYHSLVWLREAKARFDSNPEAATVSEADILVPLALSLAVNDNMEHAMREAARLLELFAEDDSAKERFLQKYPALRPLLAEAMFAGTRKVAEATLAPISNERQDWRITKEQLTYEALCRGEKRQTTSAPLTCHYERSSPYLRLAPVKVEVLSKKPVVLLYRSVISDAEIKTLQSIAKDKMRRSKVNNGTTGVIDSPIRSSCTGWLQDSVHPDVAAVRKRVGTVTGLDMETAEPLQVTQYGVGGHYGPHYDHATDEDRRTYGDSAYNKTVGDRIATFMFYLNEPKAGGGTVFPLGQIVVLPSKNDAVFWYNLKKSGAGDCDTIHAGCPVLSGVKWVANQWIRERGQEFTRPCGLRDDE